MSRRVVLIINPASANGKTGQEWPGLVAEAQRLAARLGAEIVTVPGRSVVEEIVAFARSRNATLSSVSV
jgi:K+-sensing histidine kinase KdpD